MSTANNTISLHEKKLVKIILKGKKLKIKTNNAKNIFNFIYEALYITQNSQQNGANKINIII